MHTLFTIVGLLIVLGVVVFVHEAGHFMAARWAGVRVDAFSIGFGPALFKWTDKHGTIWKLCCLPLGGYVSIYGQEDMFHRKKYADLPKSKKVGHYLSVPAWKQFIIIAAGVFMNFMLAWLIYSADFMFRPRTVQLPVIGQVVRNSAAFNAGIKPGDVIMKINNAHIDNWGELIIAKELSSQHDANVLIARKDKLITVQLKPVKPTERWGLIADGSKKTTAQTKSFFNALYSGLRETYYQSKNLLVVLKQIINGERSSKQLGSFITIAQVSGQALEMGFFAFMAIIALLSVNLGIINLLPLPVLDGGYLLILFIEAIIRRKLDGKAMDIVIICGWILIMLLFLFTMWNDIARVFRLN